MPLCGNTQRSRGTPRASARSAEHRITRGALLDRVVGVHELRVREADHAVVGATACGSPRRCTACWIHACGLAAATSLKPAHSSEMATRWSSTLRPEADAGAPARTSGTPAPASPRPGPARRARPSAPPASTGAASGTSSPCTVQSSSPSRRAGAHPGAPRLGPADEHEVGVAGLDVEARLVDQGLRAVAAHARTGRVARGGAEALGDERGPGRGSATTGVDTTCTASAPVSAAVAGAAVVGGPAERPRRSRSTGSSGGSPRSTRWLSWPAPMSTGVRGSTTTLLPSTAKLDWLVKSREVRSRIYNRRIDVLLLCTANQCRSPMAEALLRHRLDRARRRRAGRRRPGCTRPGSPATDDGVDGHGRPRPRPRRPPQPAARRSTSSPRPTSSSAWPASTCARSPCSTPTRSRRTFTLKELVAGRRRRRARAARASPSAAWLGRVGAGRRREALLGVGHDDDLDVEDPVGRAAGRLRGHRRPSSTTCSTGSWRSLWPPEVADGAEERTA